MNGRLVAGVVGLVVFAFGLAGLLYPERVMHYAGFAVASTASLAQATAETRAIYGGLFVVLAMWIMYAAFMQSRQLLLFAATLFLGAAAGRLGGAYVAGSPGLWGWIGVIIETALGVALLAAALSVGRTEEWAVGSTVAPAGPGGDASSAPASSAPPTSGATTP
ncbi:MAG: DUF4345 family protein [Candidatus Binatia bacterium]|nr:DUF4345 family protein [Candidatus Binatia bacterium]